MDHAIFATLMKAPRICETQFRKLFMKGRNDEEKPKDSNNDDVAFTPSLSEKISNNKIIKLWCAFCSYDMAVRTVLKYSRVVRTVFKYNRVFRIIFKYIMVVHTIFKYSRVIRTVLKYVMVVCAVFKYSRVVPTVFK